MNEKCVPMVGNFFETFHRFTRLRSQWTTILPWILPDFTPSDHKYRTTQRYPSLLQSVNEAAMLNVSQYYHESKDNENKGEFKQGEGSYCLYPPYFTVLLALPTWNTNTNKSPTHPENFLVYFTTLLATKSLSSRLQLRVIWQQITDVSGVFLPLSLGR